MATAEYSARTTWWLVLGIGIACQVALWWISEPASLFSDFYKAYYPVADHLWFDGPREPMPQNEAVVVGFVNLPIIGWLFVPLLVFGEEGSSWAWLVAGAIMTAASCFLLIRRFAPAHAPLLVLLFCANGPLVNSLREGNSTHLVLLLAILGLMAWRDGRGAAAGALFALCGIIKLPLLLFGAYFVLRRQWRVVAGGAATVLGLAVLSFIVHGADANLAWYRQSVEPFLSGVIPAFNVQSIDGFLMRLATGVEFLMDWTPHKPTVLHRATRMIFVVALLAGTVWLCLRRGPAAVAPQHDRDLLECGLVLTLALVISPLCWSHYYLLMLLPAAIYLGDGHAWLQEVLWRRLFWTGYVLSSLPIVILPLAPDRLGEVAARTIVSLWLFGGLAMLAAQARALWRAGGIARLSPA